MGSYVESIILAVQILIDVLLSWLVFRAEGRRSSIERIKEELEVANKQSIDQRFESVTREINSHVDVLVKTIEDVQGRLERGESRFEKLGNADHHLELKSQTKAMEVMQWVRDNAASKQDMREHEKHVTQEMNALRDSVVSLRVAVGQLATQMDNCVKSWGHHG